MTAKAARVTTQICEAKDHNLVADAVRESVSKNVLYEKRDAIAYVTINRPKVLNALGKATWADLRAAFEDARDDDAVRGVILTGAGDKAFAAGADISELAQASAVQAEQLSRLGREVLDLVENLGKPVVAGSTASH